MNSCILEKVTLLESCRKGGKSLVILIISFYIHTLKNALVDPDSRQPYFIFVCLERSSADSMGDSILSTVRNAARFAV